MKWNENSGKIFNDFKILGSFVEMTDKNTKVGRVKVECQKCGKTLIKASCGDINSFRCSCAKKEQAHRQKYEYNGKMLYLHELAEEVGISRDALGYRLKSMSFEDAVSPTFHRVCKLCGKEFDTAWHTQIYCSPNCRHRANKGRPPLECKIIKCPICGEEFETILDKAHFCSKKCARKAWRAQRKDYIKALKVSGDYDDSITLEAVYDKFNGKCNICGKPLMIDGDCRGEHYPTIDHIKPLSKGGVHSWDNVQLLCRYCNGSKGDKYDDG